MSKITIPYKEYNAMRISRVLLWILFIFLLPGSAVIFGILMFASQAALAGEFVLISGPFLLLSVSLLFLRKYRGPFLVASFYLHALYFFVNMPALGRASISDPMPLGLYAADALLVITAIASFLIPLLLTFRLAGKGKLAFAKWIAVAYAIGLILTACVTVFSVVANLNPNLPEATPLNIFSFIIRTQFSALFHLVFAYIGYHAFNDTYCNYFVRQPFSRVIQENTILFH